jgi:type I restriction-modification system DNA methylase subunit
MLELNKIIEHVRNRVYMSGLVRDNLRVKQTGEIFTPTDCVQDLLNLADKSVFSDPAKTICDNSCGDGQFLGEVLIRKVENGVDFETALSTIFGVDIMIENVELCRERLLCGIEDLRHIVEQNIVCADALRYHYRFDNSDPYKTEQDLQFDTLFE